MSKSSMWPIYLMYLCLLAAVHTFDLKKFCLRRCSVGQGGNLCRCTAHHFAGKRSDTHAPAEVAAAANLDVEGLSRRSPHGGNINNEEEDKVHLTGAGAGPDDLQVYRSMNDDLLSNSQVLYPLMDMLPAESRRATLMDENMELLQGDSAANGDKPSSLNTLNILAKRYRQQLAGGVLPSYKRILSDSSPDSTAQLKEALEKAFDNKASQRILKLLLSKVSR